MENRYNNLETNRISADGINSPRYRMEMMEDDYELQDTAITSDRFLDEVSNISVNLEDVSMHPKDFLDDVDDVDCSLDDVGVTPNSLLEDSDEPGNLCDMDASFEELEHEADEMAWECNDPVRTISSSKKRRSQRSAESFNSALCKEKPSKAYVTMTYFLGCFENGEILSLMKFNFQPVLLIYEKQEGRYRKCNCNQFSVALGSKLHGTKLALHFSSRLAKDVFFLLLNHPDLQTNLDDFDKDDRFLNVLNGVVDLETGILLKHSMEFKFLSVRCCNYKESYAKKDRIPPMFKAMLERHFPHKEDRDLFLECLAYLISWKHGLKIAPFWIGEAHTGKSTFERLLTMYLGDSVAHHSLAQISSKHGSADLEGIGVNICSEVQRSVVKDMDRFKAIVGGDPISVEPKFRSLHSMKSMTKILLVGNDFMLLAKGIEDKALVDRLLPIVFQNPYEERERKPMFDEELFRKEGKKIFAVLVRTLCMLRDREYRFTVSKLSAREKKRFMQRNSPMCSVECFLDDVCETAPGAFCKSVDLFNAYCNYCTENGFDAVKKEVFYRTMPAMIDIHPTKKQDMMEGKQYRGYEGIRVCFNKI